ncbi:MAG: VTT domain-containing protein [Faecalibacterium sp.]|nr:VTT domain-containing protein [Ruminococcus sp.]MCM1391486.1 VTT domain-containing protein [Ruminococcus sp.]MCM1485256.1 VTT domain-containing protein [Faecalibacterium sp.]
MNEKTKNTLKVLLRVAIAMIIFVVAIVNYDKLKNIDVRALVESSSSVIFAVAAILGIYLVKSVLFVIPASLVYISVGMAFSPWQAILINLAGIIIEVVVTYFLGVFLGGEYVNNLLAKSKGGRKILDMEMNNNFPVLLGIRFLPVFPIDFVSLFWGASKCKFPRYFFASVLGIMPRVILFTILGDGIYDYIPIHLIVKIIICAIPVAVIVYLIKHFVSARKNLTDTDNE